MAPNIEGGGFVFITPDSKILLLKCALSGKLGFCKGHYEKGDDFLIITARREANEELGLSAEDYDIIYEPFWLISHKYQVKFHYALLKKPLEELVLQASEISDVCLVNIDEMIEMPRDSLNRFAQMWLTSFLKEL